MRRRLRWFWVLAPLSAATLCWASWTALQKERAVNESRHYWSRRAEVQRVVDRLDSLLTVLVTRESELAPDAFVSFTTGRTVRTEGSTPPPLPSPLIRPPGLLPAEAAELSGPLAGIYHSGIPNRDLVWLYFELSSPERETAPAKRTLPAAPTGDARELAITQGLTTAEAIARVEATAADLEARVPAELLHRLATTSGALPRASTARQLFTPVLFAVGGDEPGAELLFLRLVSSPTGLRMQGIWYDWARLHGMLHAVGTAELASGELVLVPSAARLVDGVALPPRSSGADEVGGHLGSLAVDVAVRGGRRYEPELWTATASSLAGAFAVYLAALGALYAFLRRSEDLAERRTRFASAVTHELRTPLTTLCMYAEMLEAGLVKDPAKVAEYHATLKRESLRLAGLVDNVLTHAGLGERGAEAQPEPIEVAGFFEGLEPRLRERCARGDLDGASTTDPAADLRISTGELPPGTRVLADHRGLERVLVNLVDNACKYGAAPIALEASADASGLHLRISDAGPGIARGHRRGLFDDYDRGAAEAKGDTASHTEGLGLGLSLARGLCRSMGGELELEHPGPAGAAVTSRKDPTRKSPPTTFHVRLPLA